MINITDSDIKDIVIDNTFTKKVLLGNQLVWQKDVLVYDNDQNAYAIRNYVKAKGYYSFATTPITGKSTDLIEIGLMVNTRTTTGWSWLLGYSVSESNRFGIYWRSSGSGYKWIFDFWRGNSGSSRKITTIVPSLNKRYDLIVGNTSLTETNTAYAYNITDDVVLIPEGTAINTTTSTACYTVSESRSSKPNYVTRYYYLKIYKQEVSGEPKVLVLDWIPVQKVSDGTWGFYDRITHNFYPSEGSEEFTGG